MIVKETGKYGWIGRLTPRSVDTWENQGTMEKLHDVRAVFSERRSATPNTEYIRRVAENEYVHLHYSLLYSVTKHH